MLYRTHNCGELRLTNINQTVKLCGWVQRLRKLGGLSFLDLRDRYGITQIVFNHQQQDWEPLLATIKSEFVLQVTGMVLERKSKNPDLPTGAIEIQAQTVTILNQSEPLPFVIQDQVDALEGLRLTYRYLDLRRPVMQKHFYLKHQLMQACRTVLNQNQFVEINTPLLSKATPEGAHDFLVPSRLHHGHFYALPQSPQLFKQLLMMSGFDRYYQIPVVCRDEDYRSDRQPEFLQLDLEMSFITAKEIQSLTETIIEAILKACNLPAVKTPFVRLSYAEAMNRFGSDKPDTRFGYELVQLSHWWSELNDTGLHQLQSSTAVVSGLLFDKHLNQKQIIKLTEVATKNHAQKLLVVKIANHELQGSLAKKLTTTETKALNQLFKSQWPETGTLLIAIAPALKPTQGLGAVRLQLRDWFELADPNQLNFLWVTDWPLFEYSEIEKRYVAAHHPFTSPAPASIADFDRNLSQAQAQAYDIVLNGNEIGGGSIRIHDVNLQKRMFKALGLSQAEVDQKFGFFMRALTFGCPPHGGIALGVDRLAMILTQTTTIRDVIAFPKTNAGICPVTGAPSVVDGQDLADLGLKIIPDKSAPK